MWAVSVSRQLQWGDAHTCWDGAFTQESCCGEPPLRTDCWAPQYGMTRVTCCGEAGPSPGSRVENLRRIERLGFAAMGAVYALARGGLEGCEHSADHLFPEFADGQQREDIRQWWWSTYVETGRLREACLSDRFRAPRLVTALLEPLLTVWQRDKFSGHDLLQLFLPHARLLGGTARSRSSARWRRTARSAERALAAEGGPLQRRAPVDIAMVASIGSPAFGRKALAGVRSALFFAEARPLRFHLLADRAGQRSLQEALASLEPWLASRGTFRIYGEEELSHAWRQVRRLVPEACLHYDPRYGSPGWLRLFPLDVIRDPTVRVLIWVDAGDYIFLSDPSKLLEHHAKFKSQHLLGAPIGHPLPFQLYDLSKMRAADWTGIVSRAFSSGYANEEAFCELGEGRTMAFLSTSEAYRDIWYWLPSDWAYEPWTEWSPGFGIYNVWSNSPYLELVWRERMFLGLRDFMSLYVHCPDFQEVFVVMGINTWGSYENLAMTAAVAASYHILTWGNETYTDSKGQQLTCNQQARGVHLVLPFHHQPWVHRLLDFWVGHPVWTADWDKGRDLRV